MSKSKRLFRNQIKAIVDDALKEAERPTLANPALATHSLVIFAIEHSDLFTEWLNEAAIVGEVPAVTADEVRHRLTQLHKVIDVAVASLPAEGYLEDVKQGIRIMRAPREDGSDERYPSPYL